MQINYSVYDPMGNITILVTSPVPVSMRPPVAKHLMETVPDAEQVGFLFIYTAKTTVIPAQAGILPVGRLEMAGGEFCGNATMSAAALIAGAQGLAAGEEVTIPLEVSGADGIVPVQVLRETNDAGYQCTVEMPLPATVEIFNTVVDETPVALPLVRLPGIAHFVIQLAENQIIDNAFGETVQRQLRELSTKVEAEAYGLIFIGAEDAPILPLLYVPAADTMVWENACGSGSAAVAAWLSAQQGTSVSLPLRQPGGATILARAKTVLVAPGQAARVTELAITGRVMRKDTHETNLSLIM
jgi:diaminopimelate epimerase